LVYKVTGKRVVKTVRYRAGFCAEDDSDGPSLRNVKTHTILEVERQVDFNHDSFSIEAANVELVANEAASDIW